MELVEFLHTRYSRTAVSISILDTSIIYGDVIIDKRRYYAWPLHCEWHAGSGIPAVHAMVQMAVAWRTATT